MWLEGSTSTSNTYSLTLGGKPVGSVTTASRGPVSLAYDTRVVAAPLASIDSELTHAKR